MNLVNDNDALNLMFRNAPLLFTFDKNLQRMQEESLFNVNHSDYSSSCYDFSRICLFGQADLIKSKCFGYSVNRFKRDKSKVSSAILSRKLTLDAPDTSSDSSESSSIMDVDPHLAVNLDEIKLPKKYNFNISFVNPDTYDVVYEPVRVIITDKIATIASEMDKIINCPNAEIKYESIEYDSGSGDSVTIDKYHKILTITGTQIIDIAIYYSREIIKYLYIKLEEQRWIQKQHERFVWHAETNS
eukprot:NODE_133_length_16612_cov_1.402531.p2 type:complete len:244 gc:universal NODE_133_length_16612_cov_1.402531:773-1504(+)